LGRGGTFEAEILEPELVSQEPEEWVCRFRVRGDSLTPDIPGENHGIDSLQSLSLALEGLRRAVESLGESYQWEGSHVADDSGIPQSIPPVYDYEFRRALGELIDREVTAHEEKEAARWRNKK
jgi:hypothetical protein